MLKLIFIWINAHWFIYNLMASRKQKEKDQPKVDEVQPSKAMEEYLLGPKYKASTITANNLKDIILQKFVATQRVRSSTYCHSCYDIAHIDPTFCTRRCPVCKGPHWKQQCTCSMKCSWCGLTRGPHDCTNKNKADMFLKCPACGIIGHSAKDCSPELIILSYLLGPLARKRRRKAVKAKKRRTAKRKY